MVEADRCPRENANSADFRNPCARKALQDAGTPGCKASPTWRPESPWGTSGE